MVFMKVLSISDAIVQSIYHPQIKEKFKDVDFVISCGDLPYYYQDFIISSLDKPLFFVRGNHDPELEYSEDGSVSAPCGGIDLHCRAINHNGILIAGVQGSIRYKQQGSFQYSQFEMFLHVFRLIPKLLFNRLAYGRYLDIFVTHASPWGIHDKKDLPHQGVKAFLWLLRVFKPKYHFHGHIHIYKPNTARKTLFKRTSVLNTYKYLVTKLELK